MSEMRGDVTLLLQDLTRGNHDAANQLMPLVYEELRRLAARHMRRERPDHTLQATALVHEAYLRLVKQRAADWRDRAHFYGIAALMMRRILKDHARMYQAAKSKGAHEVIPLDEAAVFSPQPSEEILRFDESLERLTELDPRQGKIVELRFFGGLSIEETAHLLGISPRTVKREWSVAKAWLHRDLKCSHEDDTQEVGSR